MISYPGWMPWMDALDGKFESHDLIRRLIGGWFRID